MAFVSTLQKDFSRLHQQGKLLHGYLFCGENLPVAGRFARRLAAFLETGSWEAGGVLEDSLIFGGEESGGIEESRALQIFLFRTPVLSPRRTAILLDIHRWTALAQNALLKIAEEPPAHGLLLATVRHPETIPVPLASRFQKVYVSERLKAADLEPEAVRTASAFPRFSPRERSEFLKELVLDGKRLESFLAALIAELAPRIEITFPILRRLLRSMERIGQFNVNKRLQLEAALSDLPSVFR